MVSVRDDVRPDEEDVNLQSLPRIHQHLLVCRVRWRVVDEVVDERAVYSGQIPPVALSQVLKSLVGAGECRVIGEFKDEGKTGEP